MTLSFADTPFDFFSLTNIPKEPNAGGHVTFKGTVRAHNANKPVAYLFYEAYVPLAQALFRDLVDEARLRFNILFCSAVHRLGRVDIGEDAVVIHVSSAHRHEAFLAARFLIDELKRMLPIWKKEVYSDGSYSFSQGLCECGPSSHHLQLTPVVRALSSLHISTHALASKRVMMVGAGGLGCPLAINLSSLGIQELAIYDGDVVEEGNLLRQFIYQEHDIGIAKASLLKRFIEMRNRSCKINAFTTFLNKDCARTVAYDYDLIIDGSDCINTKSMLKQVAFETKTPLILSSVHQVEGEVETYYPESACLNCHSGSLSMETVKACETAGVFTHICGLVAAVASDRALLVLSGKHNVSELAIVSPTGGIKSIAIEKDWQCQTCGQGRNIAKRKQLVRLAR